MGTGNLPKFEHDLFKVASDLDLYLILMADVPLATCTGRRSSTAACCASKTYTPWRCGCRDHNACRETSSCSNNEAFQARRARPMRLRLRCRLSLPLPDDRTHN